MYKWFYLLLILILTPTFSQGKQLCREALKPYKPYNLTERAESAKKTFDITGRYPKRSHENWLDLRNLSLRYEVLPPLTKTSKSTFFFLGGLGYEVERFWANRKFFNDIRKRGTQIVFIEMPGQGETLVRETVEKLKRPLIYTVENQKAVVHASIEALREKELLPDHPFHFGGLSYGGWLLTSMAKDNRFQSDMKSLTLIATGVKSLHKFRNSMASNPLSDLWSNFAGNHPMVLSLLHDQVSGFIIEALPHLAADPLKVQGSSSLTTGIYLEEAQANLRLAPKNLPIKLMVASKDEVVPGEMHWELAQFIRKKNARLNKVMVLKPSTHDIPAEKGALRQRALSHIVLSNVPAWSIMTSSTRHPSPTTGEKIKGILDKSTKIWLKLHH